MFTNLGRGILLISKEATFTISFLFVCVLCTFNGILYKSLNWRLFSNAIFRRVFNTSLLEAERILAEGNYEKLKKNIIDFYELDVQKEQRQATATLEKMTAAQKANGTSYNDLYRIWVASEAKLKSLEGTLKRNADGTFKLTEEYKKAKVVS